MTDEQDAISTDPRPLWRPRPWSEVEAKSGRRVLAYIPWYGWLVAEHKYCVWGGYIGGYVHLEGRHRTPTHFVELPPDIEVNHE